MIVKGRFVGWQVAGCTFPAQAADKPSTRSDWLIQSGDVCVYVTGGFPEGASPFDLANVGRSIEVEAEVLQAQSGKIYLKFRKGKIE